MNKTWIFLSIIVVFLVLVRFFVFRKKLYWFSETSGQVLREGRAVENARVVRTCTSSLLGNHTEEVFTGADGAFYFPELTKTSSWWFLAPLMHGGISQLIEIEFEGKKYVAWSYFHTDPEEANAELEGKEIRMTCELTLPERTTKVNPVRSVYGIAELDIAYDKTYSRVEGRLFDQKDELLEASRSVLLTDQVGKDLIEKINHDGVLEVTGLRMSNFRDLNISDFSLTDDEHKVSFQRGLHLYADFDMTTRNGGRYRFTNMGVVNYCHYDLQNHTLTQQTAGADGPPFLFDFNVLYTEVLDSAIDGSLLEEGLVAVFNARAETTYQEGVKDLAKVDKVLNVTVESVHSGSVSRRDPGVFVALEVIGKALATRHGKEKTVDFRYIASVKIASIYRPPYVYMAEDYEHLWEKVDGHYAKVGM